MRWIEQIAIFMSVQDKMDTTNEHWKHVEY